MLGSPVLGTAVGLVVLFATTALLCSGITESISNVFQMRAKYLLTGMRAMLDDPEGGGAGRPNALRRWWAYLQAGLAARRDQRRRARTEPAEAAKAAVKKAVEEAVEAAKTGTAMAPEVAAATAVEAAAEQAVKAASRQERIAAAAELRQPTLDVHDRVKDPEQTKKAVEEVRARMAGTSTSTTIREPMTTALWNSPLLRSLQSQRINGVGAVRNPQYVSGKTFARALVDLLVAKDADGTPPAVVKIDDIREAVEKLPGDWPLRRPLLAFLARAGTRVTAFERAVEQWYDEQMAKIAGWYKRWSRVILGVVGFLVAIAINVDTLQVGHSLYVDAPLQQAVVATADAGTLCQGEPDPGKRQACVEGKLNELRVAGIPFGYAADCDPRHWTWGPCWRWSEKDSPSGWDFPRKVLGWLITAFAVSFGAPFWFEALSRLGSLRNAGTKPSSTASG